MNRTRWTLGLAILSITILIGLGFEGDKTPEPPARTTPVTVTLAPPSSAPATTTSTSTTTVVATPTTLSAEQIAEQAQLEIDMYHDWVDEQRMLHGRCGEWHDLALEVGWTEAEWDTLSTVLYTESRCQFDAWNGHDAGLTQINQIHSEWLAEMGYTHPDDMFDPRLNLWFAYRLYSSREEIGKCGWKPWSEPCR